MDKFKNEAVCRLCLCENSVFSIFCDELKIFSSIEICCSLQLAQNDGLPDKICEECKSTLDSFIQFRNTCHESDIVLRESNKIIIVKEEINDTVDYSDNVYDCVNDDDKIEYHQLTISVSEGFLLKGNDSDNKNNNTPSSKMSGKSSVNSSKTDKKRLRKNNSKKDNIKSSVAIKEEQNEKSTELKNKRSKKCKVKDKKNNDYGTSMLCPICGKTYLLKRFARHLETHNTIRGYTCDVCKKNFNSKNRLRCHITTTHFGKRFPCHICGKLFKKSTIYKHIKIVHYKKTLVTCAVCGLTLLKKSLAYHMRVHNGERDFGCELCNYKCASKTMLNAHLKAHSGVKPHKCNFCDSYFSTPRYRLIHERLHTGETPYKCPSCDKGFAQLCNMKSHFKHNHKDESFDQLYKGKRRPTIQVI